MRRVGLAAAAMLFAISGLGCAAESVTKQASSRLAVEPRADEARFGPTYAATSTADGVVAATLRGAETTGAPVVSGEIRGYLVDWAIREGQAESIWEMVVLKDGTLARIGHRPAASFGAVPPDRLKPEPEAEARARSVGLDEADSWVDANRSGFLKARPVVYNYLVRLHHADGSITDVWVDPDVGGGRFFYDVPVDAIQR